MRSELFPDKEVFSHTLYIFLLLVLSLLAVQFPIGDAERRISSEEDLEKLSPPEKRVARKLLSLGLQPTYETRQILLSEGVSISKHKNSKKQKKKALTIPDFHVSVRGMECFIEVGSNRADSHKNEQQKIAEEAIRNPNAQNMVYTQLFNGHIDLFEEQVQSVEQLLPFLYSLSHTVRATHR